METDIHFARLLADLPEALVCDEAFLGELAKNAKLISVKKGDYLLRTGELCQDAYFINNLQLDYHLFPQRMQRISFQLLVNNLFDVSYENNAYGGASSFENGNATPVEKSWAYYYPQAGTNVMGKITLSF